MVYIKRLELSQFKSFGGTTQIPLLPGFTVVSGPNGSGKSNILDALLFALGLASSRGMRAERLPDLVNHNKSHRGTVEASVTVTFDLGEEQRSRRAEEQGSGGAGENSHYIREWSVTRKLRVTQQGTYTSTYYINGEACTLTELHEELNRLRIYPEGYNVVLQGDVTSIISMNPRERREIIDELAGVAAFDRKIVQAKETLNEVKDREDSFRIVEKELVTQCDRLSQDRIKAEKYQKLRAELHQKSQWEVILVWRSLQAQQEQLIAQIQAGDSTSTDLTTKLAALTSEIQHATDELNQLNTKVKALGESELLAMQANLATQEAERRQLQRQQQELSLEECNSQNNIKQKQLEIQQHQKTLEQLNREQKLLETQFIQSLEFERNAAQETLEHSREEANAIADASDVWIKQQTALNRQIEALLQTIEPQAREQAQLKERNSQLERQIEEQTQLISKLEPEIADKKTQIADTETQLLISATVIESLSQSLAAAEQDLQIQQQTQNRLLQEQQEKQRAFDKLEAQTQALQETQGTYATKVILQSGLNGVCGLVAQLGKVEPRYQLALETTAGGRLGQLVVEDDAVAAAGIELLKQKRAGRATFLPLNKIQPQRFAPTVALRYANGFVDYAINLIECDRRYQNVFAYVFGSTVIFDNLGAARQFLGQHRIVTLAGELLEASGAMTGGSSSQRSGLHFGTGDATESDEAGELRNRLQEITLILERCSKEIETLAGKTKHLAQELIQARQNKRESQLKSEQLQKEINSLTLQLEQTRSQVSQTNQQLAVAQSRLEVLDRELPAQEAQLQQLRQELNQLEQSQTNSQWQQIQLKIKSHEQQLQEREKALREAEQNLKNLENTAVVLQEKIRECLERLQEYQKQESEARNQGLDVKNQIKVISEQITAIQADVAQVEQHLGAEKQKRDRAEQELRNRHLVQQQLEWEYQKLQETQLTRREELATLQTQLRTQRAELPDPMPEVPTQVDLEQLQREMRSLSKRLQAMEPVNMLALEEYERTTTRLEELTQKLLTLEGERTELLLRIENFTTLRQQAFKEAFDAVNDNFQTIFGTLSEGDGYLQLDDPEDIFNSGLNLVAHPKGKPVQRLSSMSGGEKSLTALSFIFALQRYRPSPFYAFDEVDMFLDGANVERLAKMIKQQTTLAQFIVVSLRRPMIEAAERTIGVTQARGAYTQVLGLKL
ncbi:MAG: chromosome segregation protein SMC [Gloeocapsa sp. UFS-A4-WI-NPMV-4B04]|jgi:chromosome segregation protein|nr:chromosome segregation protein SMC [Gloeocapsa sp. UFS-A4-WI-NPMV-4B04]